MYDATNIARLLGVSTEEAEGIASLAEAADAFAGLLKNDDQDDQTVGLSLVG